MLTGVVLTSVGVFSHTGPVVAPGATLALVGGAWFGSALARRHVRLLPGSQIAPLQNDGAA
jgi:hypothetical protein